MLRAGQRVLVKKDRGIWSGHEGVIETVDLTDESLPYLVRFDDDDFRWYKHNEVEAVGEETTAELSTFSTTELLEELLRRQK